MKFRAATMDGVIGLGGVVGLVVTLVAGGCVLLPPGDDSSEDDSSEDGSDSQASAESFAETSEPDTQTTDDPTSSTGAAHGSSGCDPGDPPSEICGVVFEPTPGSNNLFMCGCEACNVEFPGVSEATGDALLAQCDCICYDAGCGGTVTGGVTTGGEGDTLDTDDTVGPTTGEGDTHSETGGEDDGPATEPTTGPG